MSEAAVAPKPKKKSMTGKILFGIAFGIFVGLFLGEPAGTLGVVGDVYVGLLQMTVLPFVVVSLISNIGRFSVAEGRALAKVGSLVLLLLFGLSLVALVVLPLSFPPLDTGAFFSASLVETRDPPNFFDLYIPSNPFYSLSSNFVPAAVLFSILVGVALTGIEGKNRLLDLLDVVIKALGRVNGFVVQGTPVGVFAIAASAAGTMTVSEFGRLQAYLFTHTFGALLMTFVVLPATISVLTPLSYGRILSASRDFLLTAWATGSLFAVLPMLIESIEQLLEGEHWEAADSHATPGVLVPLGYPFPTVGKLLALVFVPFVAWFLGTPLALEKYPLFLSAGLFSSFGSLVVTIPFLLELLVLPSDFFNLFLMAGVWSARLGDLAGGMHLLAFSVLTMAGLSGRLRFHPRRAVTLGIGVVAITAGLVVGTRLVLSDTFTGSYTEAEAMKSLHGSTEELTTTVLSERSPNPAPLAEGQTRIERAIEQGVLRVGFVDGRLPWSFVNSSGELVGFDIDLVKELARRLEVDLELVPYREDTLAEQLADDHFDFAVGGIVGTLRRANDYTLTDSYLTIHAAILVADHRRKELDTIAELQRLGEEFTYAVVGGSISRARARQLLPLANEIELESEAEFFELEGVDALVTSAEGGSAWTLAHPSYKVVLPIRPAPEVMLVFAVAQGDRQLAEWLGRWFTFERSGGTFDEIFAHWIRGETAAIAEPRWSIGRDLFGWW